MDSEMSDPVIDEIREIRDRIWNECDRDPAKLGAYYMKTQEKHKDRLVNYSQAPAVKQDDIDCAACREFPSVS